MPSDRLPLYLFVGFGLLSIFYQTIGRDLWVQIGFGRSVQPVSEFPYTCRRIRDPGFEACEDMWLSESTRQLFMACSDPSARTAWMPNIGRLNAAGRSKRDKIIVLDIDSPVGSSFTHRTLSTPDYTGIHGDGTLSLVAVTGVDHPDHIDLFLNNNRPSINPATGALLDNTEVGANSTVEHFRLSSSPGTSEAKHIKTFSDPNIATPNRVAPTASGDFFITNDHGTNRLGIWHTLSPILKSGDITYCSSAGLCKRVEKGLAFPNGLMLSKKDNLLYIPSTSAGTVRVYQPQADGSVKLVDIVKVGYPLDNISEDANGDLWAAGFPKLLEILSAFDDPLSTTQGPSAIFRLRKRADRQKGYEIQKVIEDAHGEVLPISTVAVHDAKTGRLFMGSVVSPFITVCDPE